MKIHGEVCIFQNQNGLGEVWCDRKYIRMNKVEDSSQIVQQDKFHLSLPVVIEVDYCNINISYQQ